MIFMFYVPMLITALATSIACATVGSLLLVRGMSFISDALGHAILLGIVISFLITKNIHSWWIFIGATMIGLFMIVCIEWLIQNKILEPDSAIGCIFPIFFAVAVLLINWYAQNIHLDLDAIFLGDLALIPFQMWTVHGITIGPYALWIMSAITLLNIVIIMHLLHMFNLTIFDSNFSNSIGINPEYFHYLLMILTSITMIGAFECAGSIIVISCMVTIPAAAYLITDRLQEMITVAILLAMIATVCGCIIAHILQLCIAGSIAVCNFGLFCIALTFNWTQHLRIKNFKRP